MQRRYRMTVLVMLLLGISLGYALLTSNLNILGVAGILNPTWNIHFENVVVKTGSVTAPTPSIDSNQTTVSYSVTLNTPGDFYEFTVDAVNAGTIDGMITEISSTLNNVEITNNLPPALEYSFTYEDGIELSENQILSAGDSETYKVRVGYKTDIDPEDLPSNEQTLNLTLTVTYQQADDNSEEINHRSLYSVLKKEATSGGLAKEYTGDHHDSFTEGPSKKIYHWYAENDTEGVEIPNKNNVVFANQCWQMIRTTDTGGVKLLYNGEALVTGNGENTSYNCGNNRPYHLGYAKTTVNLNGNYYYASDYTASYDGSQTTYSLVNPVRVSVTSSNAENSIANIAQNNPYTFLSTSETYTGTNTTLYKIDSRSNNTRAYAYQATDSDSIGKVKYNNSYNSIADSGYMYNTRFTEGTQNGYLVVFYNSEDLYASNLSKYENYYYADSYTMSGNNHVLTNPVKGNTIENYPSGWVGKYYCKSSTSSTCAAMYYIGGINTSEYYPKLYYNNYPSGKRDDDLSYMYLFGDSIEDKGNGVFEISGNTQELLKRDWAYDYENKTGKYMCKPGYYTYDSASNKYICSDNGEQEVGALSYIAKTEITSPSASPIYKYGYSVEADGNSYKLAGRNNEQDTLQYIRNIFSNQTTNCFDNDETDFSNCGLSSIAKSHHTCYNLSGKCDSYFYIYYLSSMTYFITNITDGKYVSTNLEDHNNVLYSMLYQNDESGNVNTNDSLIKESIDKWYKDVLYNDYDSFIEDTIYCNNRSISDFGSFDPTFNKFDTVYPLLFGNSTLSNDLSCQNITDKFSVANNSAKLTYKTAPLSAPEMNLLNNKNARTTSTAYWLSSPYNYRYGGSTNYMVSSTGDLYGSGTGYENGIRPAISLRPGIEYTSGTGTIADPYIVDTSGN